MVIRSRFNLQNNKTWAEMDQLPVSGKESMLLACPSSEDSVPSRADIKHECLEGVILRNVIPTWLSCKNPIHQLFQGQDIGKHH